MPVQKRSSQRGSYLKRFIQQPVKIGHWPSKGDRAHTIKYRRPFFIASVTSLLTLISVILVGVAVVYFANFQTLQSFKVFGLSLACYLILSCIDHIVRRCCHCPLCRGLPLIDGRSQKHHKAFRIRPLSFGSSAALMILFTGRFRCPHCGTSYCMSSKDKES